MHLIGLFVQRTVLFLMLIAFGAGAFVFLSRAVASFFHGEELTTPNFVGETVTYALENEPPGVNIQISEKKQSMKFKKNFIMDQIPKAGTVIKKGRTIHVVVSLGMEQEDVPDLVGMNAREAGLLLRNQGLFLGRQSYMDAPLAKEGVVIAQYPPLETPIARGEAVSLLIGTPTREKPRMPNFRQQGFEQVRRTAEEMQIQLGEIRYFWNPGKKTGIVLEQEPMPGTEWNPGSTFLNLTINRREMNQVVDELRKKQRVEMHLPPGLANQILKVELVDAEGTKTIHEKEYEPDATFFLDVDYGGSGFLNLYLNDVFYQKMDLSGEAYENQSR